MKSNQTLTSRFCLSLFGVIAWSISIFNISAQITPENPRIPVEYFDPSPIRITLEDLPKPYATESASNSPQVVPPPHSATLQVPEGFSVNIFAENLDKPRWLRLTPDGDVLVTETYQNRIRALRDKNSDGVADETWIFASEENGLHIPFGMDFSDKFFFLGNTDAILRFPFERGQRKLSGKGNKITSLPGQGYRQHWTRNVRVHPDGSSLFATVGSKSNVDIEEEPMATVLKMDLEGGDRSVFASGLRNPVGLDFHPISKEVYVTVNERDGLGDNLVPDFLTRVQRGEFYGWPYAYLAPNFPDPRHVKNGKSAAPAMMEKTQTPDVLFESHSAALGLAFYVGGQFPDKYRNGAFVAFRGSWNRSRGTGYKIVFVPFGADHRPVGYYEDFLKGFLIDPDVPRTWGRPVGVLYMPDGSILFTEEANGRIYRVAYGK
jgi:glucose/arabinose dehydrogenase